MKTRNILLSALTAFVLNTSITAQNEPVIIEAESGTRGTDFAAFEANGVQYVAIQTNLISSGNPGNAARIISFEVTFPDTGTYDLYGRVRVGPAADNDDSFFYPNGFGTKDPADDNDWITVNNISGLGFSEAGDVVYGIGGGANNIWKWFNLSENTGHEAPIIFRVDSGNLTQTFQVGAREDGLSMDKFAFGRSELFFTVSNLDSGEPGVLAPPLELEVPDGPSLALGKCKFLGSAHSQYQAPYFDHLWNQVTPEDAGKWSYVEGVRDVMNWSDLDSAYHLAIKNGFPFQLHVLIWGNQQPVWIETLDSAEQRQEIEEWFSELAARYDSIDIVQVVNEPLHDPPDGPGDGNYIKALGGTGSTGWDWVIEAFQLARQYFPDAGLMINDYNIVNSLTNTDRYIEIIQLLKARNLVDAIGVQAHAFATGASASTMIICLDRLAETGLPIYATEFDINGMTDASHLSEYQRVFPVFWEHPAVKGVTLWGYRPGMWNSNMAYLLNPNGSERPSMTWLKGYVDDVAFDQNCLVAETSIQTLLSEDDGSVVIYPNPVTGGHFSVKGIENIKQVTVLNLIGTRVAVFDNLNQSSVDISIDVIPGIYIIRCDDGQRLYFRKILVR